MSNNYALFDTPLGPMRVEYAAQGVTALQPAAAQEGPGVPTALTRQVQRQMEEYFAGQRRRFSFPLAPAGTAFQQRVWRALLRIPYGETRSYGQIARQIGDPGAARAVGMACHYNPILIAIPCHRVVGADGRLGGYAYGLDMKRRLLELERGG